MSALCVIHPGFHKTGTSTIEHTLLRNAAMLRPYVTVLGRPQLGAAPRLAKIYSSAPDPNKLQQFRQAFAAAVPRDGPVLVSCVDLIGRIPGHPNVSDYSAVPALLRAMRQVRPVQFAMGLRPPAEWLRSLWSQNLKVHREQRSAEDFAEHMADISDLKAQIAALEADLDAPIISLPLRQGRRHPDGPTGPLLDLFDVPDSTRAQMTDQAALKVGLSKGANELLLEMNRSELSDEALRVTKGDALAMLKRMG